MACNGVIPGTFIACGEDGNYCSEECAIAQVFGVKSESVTPFRRMPKQKPGKSIQDYGTPRVFLDAVEKRWGKIDHDLAAHSRNAVASSYFSIDDGVDSLTQDWTAAPDYGRYTLWLNPPYADIAPWAKKCAEYAAEQMRTQASGKLLFLTPASVGANWFWRFVAKNALVLPLHPRLVFDGTPINPKTGKQDPYPKDLMISVFGMTPGFERWEWMK